MKITKRGKLIWGIMNKIKEVFKSKQKIPKGIEKKFSKGNLNYVLITCTKPDKKGKMEVEMCYEGDETLVSYLVNNAGEILDERLEQASNDSHSKRSCL